MRVLKIEIWRWAVASAVVWGAIDTANTAYAGSYSFSTIIPPAAINPPNSTAFSINNLGQILLEANTTAGDKYFLFSAGTYAPIDIPTGHPIPFDINDAGQIVGVHDGPSGYESGFVYSSGIVSDISFGLTSTTLSIALGINNSGQIVGGTNPNGGLGSVFQGYLDDHGLFSIISPPGGGFLLPHSINDSGDIAGGYCLPDPPCNSRAFVFSGGVFSDVLIAGSTGSTAFGINDAGDIIGDFLASADNHIHGFVDVGGVITAIDVPGAKYTAIYGINNAGDLVGAFLDARCGGYGFLAVPVSDQPGLDVFPDPPTTTSFCVPEPSTLALLGVPLVGLGFMRRKRAVAIFGIAITGLALVRRCRVGTSDLRSVPATKGE